MSLSSVIVRMCNLCHWPLYLEADTQDVNIQTCFNICLELYAHEKQVCCSHFLSIKHVMSERR